MRECHRVLVPGGRVALLSITTPSTLTGLERERAADAGPQMVATDTPIAELARAVGFEAIAELDRTTELEDACARILQVRAELEVELRKAEGDDVFEEEVAAKERLLAGIRAGLLERVLLVAERVV